MDSKCEEEVEDLTTCSICFLGFDINDRKPKFLPCSHTFCLSCLTAMSSKKEESMCPNCRKSCLIQSADILPNNIYALQLIKMSQIMTNAQQLVHSPRWCLTCQSIAKEACINKHSTISLAEAGEELQKKIDQSERKLNEALEKRTQMQIHFDAVLKSLKEVKHSIKKEVEENSEHTLKLMTALENIDKLKNATEDISGAREKIENVFQEAEKELKLAAELADGYKDQTEIRVLIDKTGPSGKSCFTTPGPPVSVVIAHETKRICPIDAKENIICCALNPITPVLVCGLESGKLCLYQSDSCFTPFLDWATTILDSSSTQSILLIDWDVHGLRFVLGFDDGLVQVWNIEAVKSFELQVHDTNISHISWNCHGATDLFLACNETSVAVCCSILKKEVQLFSFESDVQQALWVNDDSFVCFCEDNSFEMYQIGQEDPVRTFLHDADDTLLGLCSMGRLASSSEDGYIRIWSLEQDESLYEYDIDSSVNCIDWCPTNIETENSENKEGLFFCRKFIASGSDCGLVHIWNTAIENENTPVVILHGHTKPIIRVSFSPDGKLLASISESNSIIVWLTKSWEKIYDGAINDDNETHSCPHISWTSSKIFAIANGSREVTILEFD